MTADSGVTGDRDYAGSNVFLVAVEPDQFQTTLADPVDLTAHEDRPAALADFETARLGAVPPGDRNEKMFERMAPGDLVLCYTDDEYVGLGRVVTTFDDDGWASALWNDEVVGGYVVEDFVEVSVPARAVNALFDYEPDYAPGGVIRVADGRVGTTLAAIRVAVERFSEQRG